MEHLKLLHKLFLFVAIVALLAGCIGTSSGASNVARPAVMTETSKVVPTAAITGTEGLTSTEVATAPQGMTATEAFTSMEGITPTAEIMSTDEMMAAPISVPFEAIQLIFEYAPGARTPFHIHGGAGLATVLEGEVTVRLKPSGEEKVYHVGEFYSEEVGEVMSAGNDGQTPARVAAMFLLPAGASLTTVQDDTATNDMPPGPTILYRNSMTITENLGNFEAIQLIFEYAPGARTPFHIHGGAGLATVLEGEVTVRLKPSGEEKVYHVGEFYSEEVGEVMNAGNDGQTPARVAAMFLLPAGASLTTVQDDTATNDMPPGPTILYRNSMRVTTTQ